MSPISRSVDVAAAPQEVLRVILDAEAYPDWQREVQWVDVASRDDLGRPARTTVGVRAMGWEGTYTVDYSYPSDGVVEYHLVEADLMTRNDARFSVVGTGDGRSKLTIAMELMLKAALPELMINQLVRKGVRDMAEGVKSQAERRM